MSSREWAVPPHGAGRGRVEMCEACGVNPVSPRELAQGVWPMLCEPCVAHLAWCDRKTRGGGRRRSRGAVEGLNGAALADLREFLAAHWPGGFKWDDVTGWLERRGHHVGRRALARSLADEGWMPFDVAAQRVRRGWERRWGRPGRAAPSRQNQSATLN